MNQSLKTWAHDTVFERTPKGAHLVVRQTDALSPFERRILLMVNGYTPLQYLLCMFGASYPSATIDGMVHQGLIAPVAAPEVHENKAMWVDSAYGNLEAA